MTRAAMRTPTLGARGGEERADGEHRGGDHDQQPAAEPVGEAPGDRRADHRPEQQPGDDRSLKERRELEVVRDEQDRARDDAGVVPEQKPAQSTEHVDASAGRPQCLHDSSLTTRSPCVTVAASLPGPGRSGNTNRGGTPLRRPAGSSVRQWAARAGCACCQRSTTQYAARGRPRVSSSAESHPAERTADHW